MKLLREIIGYALGCIIFVVAIPLLMWLLSGMPPIVHIGALRATMTGVLMIGGIALSVWTIVYMRRIGNGNPMDAFNHEIAPRTQHLMIEGPYSLSRNPMLSGTFVYLIGCCVWLFSWQTLVVFLVFVAVMLMQVHSEEKRLRRDFGDEYDNYCRRTGRFFPKRLK